MTWIRNNRFLAVFFACMGIGVLALGYLLYSAYSSYSDISDSYDKQATELVRLQSLTPYPDNGSLKKLQAQKAVYAQDVADLQTTLAAWNRRLQPIVPQQFQEELKQSAANFVNNAAQTGLKLPDDFYLGFDDYRDAPPNPDAASPLERELKGAEILLNELLESRATSIVSFTRIPLDEEQATPEAPSPAKLPSPVSYYPFDLKFTSGQSQFRRFMNTVVREKQQFFVIRSIEVMNSNLKGPHRIGENPEAAGSLPLPDGPAGASSQGPAGVTNSIQFILGKEFVTVSMRIEIVEFAVPASGP